MNGAVQRIGGFFKRLAPGRVMLLVISGIVLAVLFVGLGLFRRAPGKESALSRRDGRPKDFEVSLEDSRKVAGFVESYGREIDDARKELRAREEELKGLREKQQKYDTVLEAILEELSARKREGLESTRRKETDLKEDRKVFEDPEAEDESTVEPPARIQKITLASGKKEAERRRKKDELHIPAGSFAEATLLTGVYAPTEGSALPVTLRLDLSLIGPNRSRIPVQEAFLIGKATGEANSRRVVIQISKLSYVKSTGETIEVPLNGYVADDDGVMGLSGQYVWRVNETAGLAILAGGLSAVGDAVAQAETVAQTTPLGGTTRTVTGDVGKFSLFRGGSRAAEALEAMVLRRLDEVVPAIYVANGKKLTVVLLDGVTLPGLLVDEVSHETRKNPYSGLDLDR